MFRSVVMQTRFISKGGIFVDLYILMSSSTLQEEAEKRDKEEMRYTKIFSSINIKN